MAYILPKVDASWTKSPELERMPCSSEMRQIELVAPAAFHRTPSEASQRQRAERLEFPDASLHGQFEGWCTAM